MAALSIVLVALQLAILACGNPNIAFPFNAQLPLAARADTFYSWSFAHDTFTSSSNMSFSFGQNHPSWLSMESESRKLYGTPKDGDMEAGDVVGQKVDIVATDNTGPTTMEAILVISRKPAPTIEIPLEEQINTFGNYSAPSSILSYPATDFKYTFNPDTFSKDSALTYYAVSSDHSPLPSWIQFENSSLTFSGKTPPFESLIQPPQTFHFNLVASDIVGFSATPITFNIVVGSHKLTIRDPIITLNVTRGTALNYDGLEKNAVNLDGNPVKSSDLDIDIKDLPKWLNFDKASSHISGTPGQDDHSSNFTITFSDNLSATLDVLIVVNVINGLFKSTLEDMEARPGSKFEADLSQYFRDPSDVSFKVNVSPTEDWLRVDGFNISGHVPTDAKGSFDIIVDANSKTSSLSETGKLHAIFLSPDGTPTVAATSKPTMTWTDQPSQSASAETGRLSAGDILLATIIPILFIALVLMLFVCFIRRRRASRSYLSSKTRTRNTLLGSFQRNSKSPTQRAERMTAILNNEKHMLKPAVAAYTEAAPRDSIETRSSETLGRDENYVPVPTVATRGQPATIRSLSPSSQYGRRSWETVEGGVSYMSGAKSIRNDRATSLNIRDSTHQVFGAVDLTGARSRALRDQNAVKASAAATLTPYYGHREQNSVDTYLTKTASSLALPINERGRSMRPPAPTITRSEGSDAHWETMTVSDVSNVDLRRPERAHLCASNTNDGHAWGANTVLNDSRSVGTEATFGSSENWRLVGRHDATTATFNEIVNEAPLNPVSETRDGALPGERSSPSPTPKSKWGEVGAEKKATVHKGMSVFSNAVSAWRKDDSGKMSRGSSFKVFI